MKDTTTLLVGHGSREESGNQEIRDFVEQWQARQHDWRIEVCFIEFAPPSLHDGLLAPTDTRNALGMALSAAAHAPIADPHYGIFRF